MKFIKTFLSVAALCALGILAVDVQAATTSWVGDAGGAGNFTDPTAWDTGLAPVTGDLAFISLPAAVVTLDSAAPDILWMQVNNGSTLNVETGGSLTSDGGGWFFVSRGNDPGTATVNMNGGDLNAPGNFVVGRFGQGLLNVNDGSVTAGGSLQIGIETSSGSGEVHLDGGTITAGGFDMGPGPATMDITDGILKISGDIGAYINDQITSGILTGFGGTGVVKHSFAMDVTTIWAEAIPEPTSIALLGLAGSLLAIGRRR